MISCARRCLVALAAAFSAFLGRLPQAIAAELELAAPRPPVPHAQQPGRPLGLPGGCAPQTGSVP